MMTTEALREDEPSVKKERRSRSKKSSGSKIRSKKRVKKIVKNFFDLQADDSLDLVDDLMEIYNERDFGPQVRRGSGCTASSSSYSSDFSASDVASIPDEEFPVVDHTEYRSLDQIGFVDECLIHAKKDDLFILHFYPPGCPIAADLDEKLEELAGSGMFGEQTYFVRIDLNFALYLVGQLKLQTNLPTIIALNDGIVLDRLSTFPSWRLDEWVRTAQTLATYCAPRSGGGARDVTDIGHLESNYRTIDNEEDFVNDCIFNGNGRVIIVHVYIEHSNASTLFDEQLETLSAAGHCKFVRISALELSDTTLNKLGLEHGNDPAVVALKDGVVFSDVGILFKGMWEIDRVGLPDC